MFSNTFISDENSDGDDDDNGNGNDNKNKNGKTSDNNHHHHHYQLRFNGEESYLNYFQPLLIKDTRASIRRSIFVPDHSTSDPSMYVLSHVQCLAIKTYTHGDIGSKNNNNNNNNNSSSSSSSSGNSLLEVSIQLPIEKNKLKFEISKDDLVLIYDPTSIGASRQSYSSPYELLCNKQTPQCDVCIVLSKPSLNHVYNKRGSNAPLSCMLMYVCMYVCIYIHVYVYV